MGQATGPLAGRSRFAIQVAARDFFQNVSTFSGAQTRPYRQLVYESFLREEATAE